MPQSKTVCPHCRRLPGERHTHVCPRSPASRRAMDEQLAVHPRGVWPAKNVQFKFEVRRPTKWRPDRTAILSGFNPGVPMVCPPKPWTAGGVPRGPLRDPESPVHGDKRLLALAFKRDFVDEIRIRG